VFIFEEVDISLAQKRPVDIYLTRYHSITPALAH
jgi:hypothetical protein